MQFVQVVSLHGVCGGQDGADEPELRGHNWVRALRSCTTQHLKRPGLATHALLVTPASCDTVSAHSGVTHECDPRATPPASWRPRRLPSTAESPPGAGTPPARWRRTTAPPPGRSSPASSTAPVSVFRGVGGGRGRPGNREQGCVDTLKQWRSSHVYVCVCVQLLAVWIRALQGKGYRQECEQRLGGAGEAQAGALVSHD